MMPTASGRRLLYIGRFDIPRLLREAVAGTAPSNHVHAVPLLGARGWEVSALTLTPAELSDARRFQRRVWQARDDCDVLLAHSYHDVRWLAATRAAGLLRVPLAVFVHSLSARPWDRIALAGCDRMFSLAAATTRELYAAGASNSRVALFEYGADPVFYRSLPWPAEPGIVVSVGVSGRDFGTLIRAARSIATEVHIVGRVAAEDAAAAPANVTFHSQGQYDLPFAALEALFQRASCVVVAHHGTSHPYGLNAVVEGMAYGRPVVLTAGEGIDLDPAALGCGATVPAGNAEALARAVNDIVRDGARARVLGARARVLIDERYNVVRMADVLDASLRTLLTAT